MRPRAGQCDRRHEREPFSPTHSSFTPISCAKRLFVHYILAWRRQAMSRRLRTYVCLRQGFMVGLYRPWCHTLGILAWRNMRKETTEKPATERQRRILEVIRGVYGRARLPALGSRDRRAGRALVLVHDPRASQGARAARPDLARSDQAARAALRAARRPPPMPSSMPILGRVAAGVPITAQEDVEGEFVLPPASCRAAPMRSCCAYRATRWSTPRSSTAI